MKAKTVLEFGTREGYSTRLFAEILRTTNGVIHTVDKDAVKKKEDFDKWTNIVFHTSKVENLNWTEPVDILYIDDWHNPWHLYYELNAYAPLSKTVMIHDVSLERDNESSLLKPIETWCHQNLCNYSIYPVNGCGLAVIDIKGSRSFYDFADWRKRSIGATFKKATAPDVDSIPKSI